MPTTAGAILVLLLALLPGRIGAFFLESLSGRDWRERDWQAVLRLLGISVVGLAAYTIAADAFHWPPPSHAIPSEVAAVTSATVVQLAIPYFGHIAASALAGAAIALLLRGYAWAGGFAYRAGAWDTFAAELVQERLVVVTLKSGDVYAGFVKLADVGVPAAERDIVLRGPALYDLPTKQYRAVGYRDLFLQAPLIDSIATLVTETDQSAIISEPGSSYFKEQSDARSTAHAAAGPDAKG